MILGVDIGNYYTKSSKGINFLSKVSNRCGLVENEAIILDGKTMYLGEGEFDSEYRKAYKENLLYLLQGAIQKSTIDKHNKVVTGLPLSQYKQDKDYLSNRIIQSGIVDDVEVVPEGVIVLPIDFEGIAIDIGGRTTDIALIIKEDNVRKIKQPFSLPKGMLNLENEFINCINNKYGLDLLQRDANRILTNGLFIYGEKKEFSIDMYKDFVGSIIKIIQVDYSLKTNNLMLIGGGAEILFNPFKKRIPQAQLIENSFFANALAYEQVGRGIW
ncbi:hypothetical protein CBE01nite_29550 [Clostridium beijerinckii]|uniref:ParM/StbA family protein n=1 Tax=Clostridium beijerinckii TaxID=1520 RepID=A0AB74VD58_CLOBE|nr:ParM/StbA family protein [Clostridium beijerinckii]NRZ28735.1 plasmid segregation protein ParM [Clostridium beijerinckii]NYB95489.1 plasmid segregation protein ParM [Clostridium beijerinckii]OOM19483.1 hypothetical protein CLBEI_50090 [Clostridium beijerinckii]QUN34413.1 ParM/StbA family protein [Clostridium beijerinckii]SQB00632.1 StbA family protein [Clostridium beijerinckii]